MLELFLGGFSASPPQTPWLPAERAGASEMNSAGVAGRFVAVAQACFEARDDPTAKPLGGTKRSVGPEPNNQPRSNANARKSEEHVRAY